MNQQPALVFLGGHAALMQPGEYVIHSTVRTGRGRQRTKQQRIECLCLVPVLYQDIIKKELPAQV